MLLQRSPQAGFRNAFFALENATNYNCLPLKISLSNCLFSGVTAELTGKMKHFSLITSCNYSSCKDTSFYTLFIIVYSYDIIYSYICCLSKHQQCHSISIKVLTPTDSQRTSMYSEGIIYTVVCSVSPQALQFLGLSIQKGHGNEKVGKNIQSNLSLKLDFVLEQRLCENRKNVSFRCR